MTVRLARWTLLGGALMLPAACATTPREPGPTLSRRTLPGGTAITIIDRAEMASEHGREWFVDYLTTLPIRDRQKLRSEVDDVWCSFKAEAEEASINTVFIIPNDAPVGGGLMSFSFKRQADGTWLTEGKEARACENPGLR